MQRTSLRVAVYTIAKDEGRHVDRYMDAVVPELRPQDGVFVLDTGSEDDTVERLRARGATVERKIFCPWRFDVARNANLQMVPQDFDVCFRIDLDEVVQPSWRAEIDRSWVPGTTRASHHYAWNHHPDGSPDVVFDTNSAIHARHGYYWKYPCHETLHLRDGAREVQVESDVRIEHWADGTKPRTSYLGLLEVGVKEEPSDPRCSVYYARELLFANENERCLAECLRYLALPGSTWWVERSYVMRVLGWVNNRMGRPFEAQRWFLRACAEDPGLREPWYELADHYRQQNNHVGCFFASKQCTDVQGPRPATHYSEDKCWHERPWDLLSIGAFYSNSKNQALWGAMVADWHRPGDPRLQENLRKNRELLYDRYSTHQRVLAAAVCRFEGPVLECGAGHYSTPLLHGLCKSLGRKLYTLEQDAGWLRHFERFRDETHHLAVTSDWSEAPDLPYGVVFVDALPEARPRLIQMFLRRSKVLVVHDAEDAEHGYFQAIAEVPHCRVDKSVEPWTAVASNDPLDDFEY